MASDYQVQQQQQQQQLTPQSLAQFPSSQSSPYHHGPPQMALASNHVPQGVVDPYLHQQQHQQQQFQSMPCAGASAGGYQIVPAVNGGMVMVDPAGIHLGANGQVYKYSAQQQHYQPQPGGGYSITTTTTEQQAMMVMNGGGGGQRGGGRGGGISVRLPQQQQLQQQLQQQMQLQQQQHQQHKLLHAQSHHHYAGSATPYSTIPIPPLPPSAEDGTPTRAYVDCTMVAAAAAAAAAATITAAAIQQHQQQQGQPPQPITDELMSSAGAIYTSLLPGSLAAAANVPPTYASTTVNGQLVAVNLADIRYKRLNSYTELCTLISPRTIFQSTLPGCVFQINSISNYLADDPSVRIFIRFCRYDPTCEEQTDHMPRGFNFIINQKAYQVKNRITFCPYDITTRVICEASNDIYVRISLDPTTGENPDDFFFGVFLLQKISYQSLLNEFHARWRHPFKAKYSIELAKKKLNPIEFDDDELAIVDKDNSIKVSLLCPITSTRIKIPVRSINCDHVHCFDVENFIKINDISPKWKCPICNQYIKFDNLILDGFFTELLKKAPPTCNDVEILPDGSYEFVIDELPPGVEEGSGSGDSAAAAAAGDGVDPLNCLPSTSNSGNSIPLNPRKSSSERVKRSVFLDTSSESSDTSSEDDSEKEKKEKREKEEEGENQQSSAAAGGKQPLVKRRKVEKIEKKKSKRSQAAAEPPKFVAKSSLTTVVNIECINLDSDDDDDADDDNANAAQGNGQAAAEVPEIANAEVENAVEDINIFPDAVDPVLAEDLDHLLNAE